jgi:hypothetical protein
MKYLRIAYVPTDATYLFCIACGNGRTEFAVVTDGEPQTGIHKSCIERVHQKRGSHDSEE